MPRTAIAIREGAPRDFGAVARIQQVCAEAAQWPVGDYSAFRLLVAERDGAIAGFCWWRQASAEESELLNLGVDPSARRMGVASALLRELRRVSAGEIFLEVAENNHGAIALYARYGWVPIGLRPRYYPGGINAVVMKNRSWYSPG